ncbi:MAG: lipopolysaccharide core heptose(I) kinase RfaP [Gammaproteobacteria bacterium]|nr:MAG: lipopolysaccharide core heptose(I) kinase RfaP [Gammaproteobacteria bacterium]
MGNKRQFYIRSDIAEQWPLQTIFDKVKQQQGKIFRSKEGRKTLQFELGDKPYFLKLHQGVGWWEIIKNFLQLRLPIIGAKNEWQAIQFLEQHELDTMTIAAYGQQGWNPAKQLSFLITDELVDTMSLEHLGEQWQKTPPSFQTKIKLVAKIALIARKMHENGMNHRDFYLCHFLLDHSFSETNMITDDTQLFLIDLHRAQLRRKVPERWLVKDIGSLYYSALDVTLTQRDLFRFMKVYSGLSLRKLLIDQSGFWGKVQQRAYKLRDK